MANKENDSCFQTLEKVNKKLIDSEKSKTKFLSLIKNEFDNPLVSMVALLKELHIQSTQGKCDEDAMSLVYMDSLKLNFQLSNIVSAAAIETGMLEKNISEFNIKSMLDDIDEALLYIFKTKQIKIKQKIRCQEELINDRDKVYTILINMIANAYQYSPKGSKIEISIDIVDKQLVFTVKNKGAEITNVEGIFDSFYQEEQGFNRDSQGLGIGLAITKSFIEFLGGEISLTRKKDKNVFISKIPNFESCDQVSFGCELDSFLFD